MLHLFSRSTASVPTLLLASVLLFASSPLPAQDWSQEFVLRPDSRLTTSCFFPQSCGCSEEIVEAVTGTFRISDAFGPGQVKVFAYAIDEIDFKKRRGAPDEVTITGSGTLVSFPGGAQLELELEFDGVPVTFSLVGGSGFLPVTTLILQGGLDPCTPEELFLSAEPMLPFRRGDFDGNGVVGIADLLASVEFGFGDPSGVLLLCEDAADANDDGRVDLADPIFTGMFLFASGPLLPAPGPACGADPTVDDLSCVGSDCP